MTKHLRVLPLLLLTAAMVSCEQKSPGGKKMIIIGMDGMDPRLCERMMDRGDLPNLDKLRKAGGFKPLGTSIPPQSPVAWSNFITGCDPGVHGIFDFIHRRPEKQCSELYYSAADTIPSEDGWEVQDHRIPLPFWPFNHKATETRLLRQGTPFWDYLDEAGVQMRIYDIPANYPPSESHQGHMCCLSGMGTPDLRGTQGKYQFFSEKVKKFDDDIGGGTHNPLVFDGDVAKVKLIGPENGFLKKPDRTTVEMDIHRDPEKPTALLNLQGQSIVLKEGEWSDWRRIDFEIGMPSFLPNGHAKGICRFFLQEVRPTFRLYVTPINIDPSEPYTKISEPDDFIEDISDELGLFYTAGFQEDHKALSNRVLNDEQFREQSAYVLHERKNLLRYATENYKDGLLFFYFSSTDLQAHMFWWDSDEKHPVRTPENAKKYNGVIEDLYKEMDKVVGDMLGRYGNEATVIVMSDHGFCNFRRQINLNAWLRDKGYLVVDDKTKDSSVVFHAKNPVDWNETRAYAVGLNGLYVNLYERERDGIVLPEERDALQHSNVRENHILQRKT